MRRGNTILTTHDVFKLVADQIALDASRDCFLRAFVPDYARYREVVVTRHLHVGVLGVHPDVDPLDVPEVPGDDTQPFPLDSIYCVPEHPALGDGLGNVSDTQAENLTDIVVHVPVLAADLDRVQDLSPGDFQALVVSLVILDYVQVRDVERYTGTFSSDEYRHRPAEGMSYAEFIEDVGIQQAEIDQGNVGRPDQLEHPPVDVPCLINAVAALAG